MQTNFNEKINYCHQVASEIFNQLFWSIDRYTYMSWGCSKTHCTFYQKMPTLMLRVSGIIHKGWVLVSLDEASDTYIITLMDVKKEVKQTLKDIYCDTLGKTIDELIEHPSDMDDKTYQEKAAQDLQNKWECLSA